MDSLTTFYNALPSFVVTLTIIAVAVLVLWVAALERQRSGEAYWSGSQ